MISLLSLGLATSAQAQVVQIPVAAPLAPGVNVTQPMNFATGNEYFAFIVSTNTAFTAGSRHGLILDTLGGANDSELAIYGNGGGQLLAWNDDGGSSPAGVATGYDSVLTFGDMPAYTGGNAQGQAVSAACPAGTTNLPVGNYVVVLSYYNTTWGCPAATATTRAAGRPSTTQIHAQAF